MQKVPVATLECLALLVLLQSVKTIVCLQTLSGVPTLSGILTL